ncbi:MAG TPA: MBL fold metallo-hydrolase [Candidatus Limnocylindrales bacterium]|nr:MBL fold metallo-hydrolase [Candidatus Limnocylindrales bacterium]
MASSGARPPATTISIELLGHSSVRIDLDGIGFLTDPATEPRIGPLRRLVAPVGERTFEAVDVVLISHLHLDHLDLPSLRRVPGEAIVVVPRGAGAWLRRAGRERVVELTAGDTVTLGGVVARAVPARHGGFRPPRGPRAEALGYVLEGSRSVYFAGDTGLFDTMHQIAPDGLDLALLPVAGWGLTLPLATHLDPLGAAHAARLLGARATVPIHWGTYRPAGLHHPALRGDRHRPPRELVRLARLHAPNARIRPLDIGERMELT